MSATLTESIVESATLRDTLLPTLISGELRLPAASLEELAAQAGMPDVEKILEDAV